MTEENGFDMKRTIDWYQSIVNQSEIKLPSFPQTEDAGLESAISMDDRIIPVENPELIELSAAEMSGLISLFPAQAIERSILRNIVGRPISWFHKDSTSDAVKTTEDIYQAISMTAIVPSFIGYEIDPKTGFYTADIHIYKLPEFVSPEVRKMIIYEGSLHELAHSFIFPALYDEYDLIFRGEKKSCFDVMMDFAKIAEPHAPISHYASGYRSDDGKFKKGKYPLMPIDEEMAESVAAYMLNFVYCKEEDRRLDPFKDRPEVKTFIEDFLKAEKVYEK